MAPQVLLGNLKILNLLNDACHQVLYFFNQMAWLLFFFSLLTFQQLQGQCLFFLKPTDNDCWIRFTQAIQRRLLDPVSSWCSLLVVLSVMEMSRTT